MKLTFTVSSYTLQYEKKEVKKAVRAAGAEVASVARALIRKTQAAGRSYSRKGVKHQASAAGSPPASLTGDLATSIKVRPYRSGEGVAIRDTAFYALFLEVGAVGGGGRRGARNVGRNKRGKSLQERRGAARTGRLMAPRPFLSLALDQRRGSIETRLKTALYQGIKFVRVKA